MIEINDGGPAFPVIALNDPNHPASVPGMSLRDWFAGQALAGLVTRNESTTPEKWAAACYILADAMLAQRSAARSEQA